MVLPSPSWAARIELRPEAFGTQHLVYTGGPGEVNDPGLQTNMFAIYVQDIAGPPTERVPPCEASEGGLGTSSRCPNVAARLVVDLGDRDDIGDVDENTTLSHPVTVMGGPGNDRISIHSGKGNVLDGGPGDDVILSEVRFSYEPLGPDDTVTGGDGNDELRVRNQRRDDVRCGAGSDVVTADAVDVPAPDCEQVELPPGAGWTRTDGRPIGVTIGRGALYTGTPRVRLKIRAPDAATHVRISNDGGFDAFVRVARNWSDRYQFDLEPGGPERLPKTVYVRFDGPGLDPSRTFTDDIILDETRPQLRAARALGRSRRGLRVALQASDSTSGVRKAQFARVRRKPFTSVRYRKRITTRASARWARVRDGAGNASGWRRIGSR